MIESIVGANIQTPDDPGTTFYIIHESDIRNMYSDDANIVFRYAVDLYGFDAFDTSRFYGSEFISTDTFVLCVTDGLEIEINSDLVDPESALSEYDIEVLAENGFVIEDPDEAIIRRFFSPYELSNDIDIDDIASELLRDGYHLRQIVEDAQELDII